MEFIEWKRGHHSHYIERLDWGEVNSSHVAKPHSVQENMVVWAAGHLRKPPFGGRNRRAWPVGGTLKPLLGLVGIVWVCAGCSTVGPQEQRLVSKPDMVFSESAVFNYTNKLLPQIEPGSTTTGSLQASGCTSCK